MKLVAVKGKDFYGRVIPELKPHMAGKDWYSITLPSLVGDPREAYGLPHPFAPANYITPIDEKGEHYYWIKTAKDRPSALAELRNHRRLLRLGIAVPAWGGIVRSSKGRYHILTKFIEGQPLVSYSVLGISPFRSPKSPESQRLIELQEKLFRIRRSLRKLTDVVVYTVPKKLDAHITRASKEIREYMSRVDARKARTIPGPKLMAALARLVRSANNQGVLFHDLAPRNVIVEHGEGGSPKFTFVDLENAEVQPKPLNPAQQKDQLDVFHQNFRNWGLGSFRAFEKAYGVEKPRSPKKA